MPTELGTTSTKRANKETAPKRHTLNFARLRALDLVEILGKKFFELGVLHTLLEASRFLHTPDRDGANTSTHPRTKKESAKRARMRNCQRAQSDESGKQRNPSHLWSNLELVFAFPGATHPRRPQWDCGEGRRHHRRRAKNFSFFATQDDVIIGIMRQQRAQSE